MSGATAAVLDELEQVIREEIVANRNSLAPHFEQIPESVEDFDIDLADYFDLVSGRYPIGARVLMLNLATYLCCVLTRNAMKQTTVSKCIMLLVCSSSVADSACLHECQWVHACAACLLAL